MYLSLKDIISSWVNHIISLLYQIVSRRSRFFRRKCLRRLGGSSLWVLRYSLILIAVITGFFIGGIIQNALFPKYNGIAIHVTSQFMLVVMLSPLVIATKIERKMRRDLAARQLVFYPSEAEKTHFVLFLRRLYSDTGVMLPRNSLFDPISRLPDIFSLHSGRYQLDDLFYRASPNYLPVLKLSSTEPVQAGQKDLDSPGAQRWLKRTSCRRRDDLGAGQVFLYPGDETDVEPIWLDLLVRLISRAEIIVLVPLIEHGSGLLRELRTIVKNNHLAKTIMIMPPSIPVSRWSPKPIFRQKKSNTSNEWNRSISIIRQEVGLDLPVHRKSGGFVFFEEGRPVLLRTFNGLSWWFPQTIRLLLKYRKARYHPFFQALFFSIRSAALPIFAMTAIAFAIEFFNQDITSLAKNPWIFETLFLLLLLYLAISYGISLMSINRVIESKAKAVMIAFICTWTVPLSAYGWNIASNEIMDGVNYETAHFIAFFAIIFLTSIILNITASYFFLGGPIHLAHKKEQSGN